MLPKSKVQAIGLLAAFAVAGFAAGAATMSRADTHKPNSQRGWSYSKQLSEQLGLTQVQTDSIHAIMHAHRAEIQAILAPVKDRMDSVRARAHDEVRAVLTPEQRVRFDSLARVDRARWDSTAPGHSTRTGTR